MKLKLLLGGLALVAATASPSLAQDPVKIGFITKSIHEHHQAGGPV